MSSLDPVRTAILRAGLSVADHLPSSVRGIDGVSSGTGEAATRAFDDAAFDELMCWAVPERLDGATWAMFAASDSPWLLDDAQHARLLAAHLDGLRAALAAESTAVWAMPKLAATNVPAWLMKGLASAHLDYPDPALRTSFDADLLVARRDLPRALDALLTAGCRRRTPPLRPWWEHRFARAVELTSPEGVEIDLHAAIVDGADGVTLDHGRLRHHHASGERSTIELAGHECMVLSAAGRLLAACFALGLSRGPNLRLARDIAQLVDVTGADIDAARRLAGDRSTLIDQGIRQAGDVLGVVLDSGSTSPDLRRRVTIGGEGRATRIESGSTTWSRDAVAACRALPITSRPAYALGVIWPSRTHLASRGFDRIGYVRHLTTTAWSATGATRNVRR